MLIRCRDCNSTIKPGEPTCYCCGSAAPAGDSAKTAFGKKFAAGIQVAFLLSAAMTVASLFFEATPSFAKCLTATVVLLFVKSSAQQMIEKRGG
jgi:hypothetical protein